MTDPTYYGEHVRTRTVSVPGDQDYEVVEVERHQQWIEHRRYGHMSNDYALHDARLCAQSLARNYIGGH